MSRVDSSSAVSAGQLAKQTQLDAVRPNRTQALKVTIPAPVVRANETHEDAVRLEQTQLAHEEASALFDEALKAAGIETSDVAYLFGVSESVVNRMRSKDARERVSFAQMLLLPVSFHWHLHKAMNRRYGFGRRALAEMVDAAGMVAVAVGD